MYEHVQSARVRATKSESRRNRERERKPPTRARTSKRDAEKRSAPPFSPRKFMCTGCVSGTATCSGGRGPAPPRENLKIPPQRDSNRYPATRSRGRQRPTKTRDVDVRTRPRGLPLVDHEVSSVPQEGADRVRSLESVQFALGSAYVRVDDALEHVPTQSSMYANVC